MTAFRRRVNAVPGLARFAVTDTCSGNVLALIASSILNVLVVTVRVRLVKGALEAIPYIVPRLRE